MFQELEDFLLAADGAKFSIPELNVLKQLYSDCCSWVNRAKSILGKLYARSDYHNVVEELTGILKEAELLGVKGMLTYFTPMDIVVFEMFGCFDHFHKSILSYAVDELPFVEKELKRFLCRKQASEVCLVVSPSSSRVNICFMPRHITNLIIHSCM